ncbi:MAG: hypothetical protein AAFR27_07345 [Pseudomonadota bacterium]
MSIAVLLLIALNYVVWDFSPSATPIAFSQTPTSMEPSEDAIDDPQKGAVVLVHTLARPLFHASRRPNTEAVEPAPDTLLSVDEPEPEIAATTQQDPPDLRILGLRITPADSRALVSDTVGGQARWIGAGDDIGGWKVSLIDPQGISLERNDQEERFLLYQRGL